MKPYQHTQKDLLIPGAMAAMFFILVLIGALVLKPFLITAPLLLVVGWLFHSLTIEIDGENLRWQFGPGLFHKSVSLAAITSVQVVRTSFFDGWGIHWGRFGWLYNVAGFDAVVVTLRGGKTFALGTDEPFALAAAIAQSLSSKQNF
jgi:hypothetical protein